MLIVGVESFPTRITEIAPAVLEHFGVEPTSSTRALAHAG
jgi:hypothetical protein